MFFFSKKRRKIAIKDFQHIDFREKNKYLQAIHVDIHKKSSLLYGV